MGNGQGAGGDGKEELGQGALCRGNFFPFSPCSPASSFPSAPLVLSAVEVCSLPLEPLLNAQTRFVCSVFGAKRRVRVLGHQNGFFRCREFGSLHDLYQQVTLHHRVVLVK